MTTALVEASTTALPEAVVRRGITEWQWRTLFNLFPGGKPDSVLLVWDYCKARQLDPMKKPCHIVPMKVKVNGEYQWRDVVMPGIYEYRITAQRTGLYLGHTTPEYGPIEEYLGVSAPLWCAMTIYRWNEKAREKVPFPVMAWFAEVVATKFKDNSEIVNERWSKAPIQMLTKCTEAAGLREAFPEEFGGEATAEEMGGRQIDTDPLIDVPVSQSPQPAQRRSQQNGGGNPPAPAVVTSTPPASAPSSPSPAAATTQPPADAPKSIGKITSVEEKPQPGKNPFYIIRNEQGYVCTTFSQSLATAASEHQKNGTPVELSATPAKNPNYAPKLEEIVPVGAATDVEPQPEPEA